MSKIVESLGFLIDRLVIANLKCHQMNHRQIDIELHWMDATPEEHQEHTKLAAATRVVNEERVALKNAIDEKLKDVIEAGEYPYTAEVRTYQLGVEVDRKIADAVKEHSA